MKNFKKLTALVLALALVLSAATYSFANNNMTDAEKLYELGLLLNIEKDEVDAELNRAVGLAMVLKAIGYSQADADAKADNNPFTDMNGYDWAKGYTALGHQLKITLGTGNNMYKPADKLSKQELVTFMLRALGYPTEEAWAKSEEWAKEAGLADGVKDAYFTKGEAAEVIFAALSAKLVGEGAEGTLIEKLVAEDEVDVEKAVAVGLMPAEAATLELATVEADNLREVTIAFTKMLDKDSAENAANYRIKNKTVEEAKLQADGKTVVLKVKNTGSDKDPNVLGNQTKTKLTVSNVKDKAGVAIKRTEVEFVPYDKVLPTVESITITGPKSFTVLMSEPISYVDRTGIVVKQGNAKLSASNKTEVDKGNERKVNVELYSSMQDGKDYEITISKVMDYAKYNNENHMETITYAKNTEVPVAKVVEADQKVVVVEFDKPVSGLTKDHFYHTFSGWTAKQIYNKADFDRNKADDKVKSTDKVSKVWVEFATEADTSSSNHPLPAGNVEFNIRAKNEAGKKIVDNWDNEFPGERYNIEIVADREAPQITSIEVQGEAKIKINFNEKLSATGKYTLQDTNGKKVTSVKSKGTEDNDKAVVLEFSDKQEGKTRVLVIEGVKDASINKNEMEKTFETIEFTDKVAPTVEAVYFNSELFDKNTDDKYRIATLYVTFSEEVDGTAVDYNNYAIKYGDKQELVTDNISFFEGSKIVAIELSKELTEKVVSKNNGELLNSNTLISITNVKDLAGNVMFADRKKLETPMAAKLKNGADDNKLVKSNQVEIKFDKLISEVGSPENFTVTADKKFDSETVEFTPTVNDKFMVTDAYLGESRDVIVLVLSKNVYETGTLAISYAKPGTDKAKIKDIFGKEVGSFTVPTTIKDEVAPALQKEKIKPADYVNLKGESDVIEYSVVAGTFDNTTTKATTTVALSYTENIKKASVSLDTFTVNGEWKIIKFDVADNVVELTLEAEDKNHKGLTAIYVSQALRIQDMNDNYLDGSTTEYKVLKPVDADWDKDAE